MKPEQLIGKEIKVHPTHWLRANEYGTIVGWEPSLRRWVIRFEAKVGGGFDGGKHLCLDQTDFDFIKE